MPLLHRFLNQWRRPVLEREFDEELRFHLEMRAEANVRAGMTRADADTEARRHFGSTLRAREGMREARIGGLVESAVSDLRHGWRVLRRQPAQALLVALTLSLGIGANAAIFSLLSAFLLRPLPFPDADRLVAVVDVFRAVSREPTSPTIPELLDVRSTARHLDGLSFFDIRDFQIGGGSEPARVLAARVEPSLLGLLGARPALGRLVAEADSQEGSERVVVLSDGLWRRNFGADPAVVGRQLMINGLPSTIAGVMAADFSFDTLVPEPIEMYVPYPMVPLYTSRAAEFAGVRRVMGIGRLKPGVAIDTASAELSSIAAALKSQYPAMYRRDTDGQDLGFEMRSVSLRERARGGAGRVRPILMILFGAVGLVLLIACVNTAQFLLAQSLDRQGEVAVRSALGAGRARLIRQFLSEAFLLASGAGVLGLWQAAWLTSLLQNLIPPGSPVVGHVRVDGAVLLFTAGVAILCTLVCGVFPALRFSHARPARTLDARATAGSRGRSRQVLVAIEVALSMVLLVSAGLLLRSINQLMAASGGYSADDVTVMRMRGMSAGRQGPTYRAYLDRIGQLPGVDAVGITSSPLPGFPEQPFTVVGREADPAQLSRQNASYSIVSPGYFSALRIPIKSGRTFAADDVPERPPVAIVNEEMARLFWPGESPLGRQIRSGPGPRAATMTIVGVVGNVRPILQTGDVPQIYVSLFQQDEPSVVLLVRSAAGHAVSAEAVKKAVWSVEPRQAVFGMLPMRDLVAAAVGDHRIVASLLVGFALLALVMSATGIYNVVTYLVSRRTKEIALRRAIGACGLDVLSLLAGQTFRWTLAGMLAGAFGAVVVSESLSAALAGVVPLDLMIVAVIAGVYLAVVALAISVPALRALRLDPATSLRAE